MAVMIQVISSNSILAVQVIGIVLVRPSHREWIGIALQVSPLRVRNG